MMNKRRCGVRNIPMPLTALSALWPKDRILKWSLECNNLPFDQADTRSCIQQAFDDWASHAGLTIREVTGSEKADFNLIFAHGDHGDGNPFEGPGGVLAHASYPSTPERGEICFDAAESWSDKYDDTGVNLRIVAAHEIGHSLGLEHSNDRGSIMYPAFQLIQPENILPKQDQNAIRALYQDDHRPPPTDAQGDTLRSGQRLQENERLTSNDGAYHLIMQSDGNLVLYVSDDTVPDNARWNSYSFGEGPHRLEVQTDGNLVVYDGDHRPIWASNTVSEGVDQGRLTLQDDGNLVFYGNNDQVVWASNT